MKSFGPKKFKISFKGGKVPFRQFFRMGWDGCALLVWPSRIPQRNSKILVVLGANQSLESLDGKIAKDPNLDAYSGFQ